MRIFLDTEFTDFKDSQLISIGMISEDGKHQIYLEVSDFDRQACNEFVVKNIFPLLGTGTQVTKAELKATLTAWFASLSEPVTIGCDSDFDKNLLLGVFDGESPHNLVDWFDLYVMRIYPEFQREIVRYHAKVGREHHALHDAIALRLGWLAVYPVEAKSA